MSIDREEANKQIFHQRFCHQDMFFLSKSIFGSVYGMLGIFKVLRIQWRIITVKLLSLNYLLIRESGQKYDKEKQLKMLISTNNDIN